MVAMSHRFVWLNLRLAMFASINDRKDREDLDIVDIIAL